MDLKQAWKKKVLSAAAGLEPAELVLKNASFVNVFTSKVQTADIAICCGVIAGIGSYHGLQELDMTGKVVVPGLIDAHMHIETSMVSPAQLSAVLTAHGTTTLITDPHEIANVMGADGIRYMLQATEGLTLDVRVMLPSCVPAASLEDGNAVLRAADLEPFYKHPRVLGLAELMCYRDAADGNPDILNKIDSAARRSLRTDGHAPGLGGKTLNAYAAAGVRADHECSTLAEAMEKLSLGQYIMIREGTAAHNQSALVPLLQGSCADRCMLCCDDRHPNDLLRLGHLDYNIRLAIRQGVDPITAVKAATYYPARFFGLHDRGANAPGRLADLVVVDNLTDFHVEAVYKNGSSAEQAMHVPEIEPQLEKAAKDTFHMQPVTAAAFRADAPCHVIGMLPGELITEDCGTAAGIDVQKDILKIAVIERHKGSGRIGIGYLHGYGLRRGAVAASVAHDAHNLIVIGTNEADMAAAANRVLADHGGIAVAEHARILAAVPLEIAGLMSTAPLDTVDTQLEEAKAQAFRLGVHRGIDPFMTLSFMSLPVIPKLRITTRGVYDVNRQQLI